jgi:large subunit ribosomal protein L2
MTTQDFDEITAKKPVKSLDIIIKGTVGRNNQGVLPHDIVVVVYADITAIVNFTLPFGTKATVEEIEYDPNRSARIARIKDDAGNYHYIIAAQGMKKGDAIQSDEEAVISTGNRVPLKNIPTGSTIYGIELQPGRGAQLVRSAGNGAQLVAKEGEYAQVKLT